MMLTAKTVLVLTPEYAPYSWGGLATYLHGVVPALVERGVRVDVVVSPTYARGLPQRDAEPPAIRARGVIDSRLSPGSQLSVFEGMARPRYDAVYVQDQGLAHLALALKRDLRCDRIIAAAHLPSYSGFSYFDRSLDDARQQMGEALLLRHSDAVIVPSAFAGDILMRVHRLTRDDVHVLPLGVPLVPSRGRARHGSALDVCVVGRIAKQKGLVQLGEVVDRTPAESATFTHIGQELRAEDRAVLSGRRIEALGQLSHSAVIERLCRADILLSTSLHETFGLAVLEAMSCGAVPVAFECGALSELIETGTNGFLLPIGDTDAMAALITRLAKQRTVLEKVRAAGFASASRYSWSAHADSLAFHLFHR